MDDRRGESSAAGAYERAVTEKKTHNFDLALPEHFAEQADEMLKSSYNLEFLGLRLVASLLSGSTSPFQRERAFGACWGDPLLLSNFHQPAR